MTKPLVFNYKDYVEIKAENKRLHKENEYLKANLRIEGRKMEYIDRMPTMHEYAEGKRIDPKLTDLISRADAICEVLVNDGIDNIVDRINKLPSAELSKGELISRADAIEAACNKMDWLDDGCVEERKTMIKDVLSELPSADAEFADMPDIPRYYYEKVVGNMAHEISMLKEQLESAVSRENIIGYIDRVRNSGLGRNKALEYIRKYVERTESADAVQGDWLYRWNEVECSVCGEFAKDKSNFCPNCGVRMKGADDE